MNSGIEPGDMVLIIGARSCCKTFAEKTVGKVVSIAKRCPTQCRHCLAVWREKENEWVLDDGFCYLESRLKKLPPPSQEDEITTNRDIGVEA